MGNAQHLSPLLSLRKGEHLSPLLSLRKGEDKGEG